MKYTFTIHQEAAQAAGDVDVVDCCIIEWLRGLCISATPAVVRQRISGYTWVSYQFAVDDMPLLGLNSRAAFRQRLQGLVQKGYFTCRVVKQRVYVKPTAKVDALLESKNTHEPLTAVYSPLTAVYSSQTQLTGVNRKRQFTNPNPIIKPLKNNNVIGSSSSNSNPDSVLNRPDHRGKPSAAKEAARQRLIDQGLLPPST